MGWSSSRNLKGEKMKVKEFLEILQEELEIEDEELSVDTNLKELDEWDSLSVMSTIALVDEHFGKKIKGTDFETIEKVNDLLSLIGKELFE